VKSLNKVFRKIKSIDYVGLFKTFLNDVFIFPMRLLSHPIKGFDELKNEKKGKMYVAIFYLFLMIVTQALLATNGGFLLGRPNDPNYNILLGALYVIVPVVLISVGNWSITALLSGKGKIKEIFMVTCYALAPYVLLMLPLIIISHFLTLEELSFYHALAALAVGLLIYLVFFGYMVIHEYGLLKNVITILLTFVALAVIIFIGILLLTLYQTVAGFIKAVYEEFIMRIS